ncbi:hypothetical protein ARALYDRAFT_342754 [Arabidopsis lyrata subsp. lyrata]|uniref:Uncharacterized protein n=1 Tax=Arabidopsis lyrata subsp. lyrata TaxID=81972 RepID=D7L7F4_ARALL|nr:hypothetical protein ARALYDRAFT_342754 [Arabidopsis lyrata subsp. lyrata]
MEFYFNLQVYRAAGTERCDQYRSWTAKPDGIWFTRDRSKPSGHLKEEDLGLEDERDVIFDSDHQTEEAARPQFVEIFRVSLNETFEEENLGFDFEDEHELNFIYDKGAQSQLREVCFV